MASRCIEGKLAEGDQWRLVEMLIFRQEMEKLANALAIAMT